MGEFIMGGRRVLPSDLENDKSSISKMRKTNEKLNKGREDLLATFSRLEMVADLLTSNGTRSNLNKLSDSATEAESRLIKSKLDSLDRIVDFMSSDITSTMKKVRDNQKVSAEESSSLVETINRLSADLKLLEKSDVISRADIHKTQMKHMKSGSATDSVRGDIVSRFLLDMMRTKGMRGSKSANRLMGGLGINGMDENEMSSFFSSNSGKRYMRKKVKNGGGEIEEVMEQMVRELSDLSDLNSRIATTKEVEELGESNDALAESLGDLANRMKDMPQFIDSTQKIQRMMDDLATGGKVDRRLLGQMLTELDTDTIPERTLYSLDKINDTMDDMVVSTEEIQNSIGSGVLGAFKEKASDFTGKPMVKDSILALASNVLGIDPMLLEGISSFGGGAAAAAYGGYKVLKGKKGGGLGGAGSGGAKSSFGKAKALFSADMGGGMFKKMGKMALKGMKFIPILGQVITAAMAVFDLFDGWTNAGEILGKAEKDLTTMDRVKAASASLLSGLTFGLLDVQSCVGYIDKIGEFFGDIWVKSSKWIGETASKLAKLIPAFFDSIIEKLKDFLPDWAKSPLESVKSAGSAIANAGSSVVDQVSLGGSLVANKMYGINNTSVGKLKDGSERSNNLLAYAQTQGLRGSDLAQFMAQTSVESGDFRDADLTENGKKSYFDKYNAGTKIGKNLGNTEEGDGFKYRGRGYIQLTGRYNYKKYGDMIGVDLINNPDLAAQPEIAQKLAVAYYQDRVGRGKTTVEATKAINGGTNALSEREAMFDKYSKQISEAQSEVENADSQSFRDKTAMPTPAYGNYGAPAPRTSQTTYNIPMASSSHPMELLGINGGFVTN